MRESLTVLIHGTLSAGDDWYHPGGALYEYIRAHGFSDVDLSDPPFNWRPAMPTDAARQRGARKLIAWCRSHPAQRYRFIGHSHGANVANIVTQLRPAGISICTLIHLSPPALSEYLPDLSFVTSGKFFTIYPHYDPIVGGVPRAEQNYQSYPNLRAHETFICLEGENNHWAPTYVRNWQKFEDVVTSVCAPNPALVEAGSEGTTAQRKRSAKKVANASSKRPAKKAKTKKTASRTKNVPKPRKR